MHESGDARRTLNLGILAHVDAGKTSLTERLLLASGAISQLGCVDDGTTQTDTLALERERGITIRSGVAAFQRGPLAVNILDTPGHPDFIAEVERALGVLDGAVLVVSAVEGVQAQTRVLMRALIRMRVPTLIFVNKIDRRVAQDFRSLVAALAAGLSPDVTPLAWPSTMGSAPVASYTLWDLDEAGHARLHERLAEHDDDLLASFADGDAATPEALRKAAVRLTRAARIYPVLFGSAATGAGVEALLQGLSELLPSTPRRSSGPPLARVFRIERPAGAEKIAVVRMLEGRLRVRDRLSYGGSREGRVTGLARFVAGGVEAVEGLHAGEIGQVRGLTEARIGDLVGEGTHKAPARAFPSPAWEARVEPVDPRARGRLLSAMAQLGEQDPLIAVRQDDARGEIHVALYGEVQKQVIGETLRRDFGVEVTFQESFPLCIERPAGVGAAFEALRTPSNPYLATVGLRVEPAEAGSGVAFRLEVPLGGMPLAFFRAVEEAVHAGLSEGVHGWPVTDCVITMTHSGYLARQSHSHAVFDKSMSSTASDFRELTPIVLMRALRQAGVVVCEPVQRFAMQAPAPSLPGVLSVLGRLEAQVDGPIVEAGSFKLSGRLAAAHIPALLASLPSLTQGEGLLEAELDHYQPMRGPPRVRARPEGAYPAGGAGLRALRPHLD